MLKKSLCIVSMLLLFGNAIVFAAADTGKTASAKNTPAVQTQMAGNEKKDDGVKQAADGQKVLPASEGKADRDAAKGSSGVQKETAAATENADKKEQKTTVSASKKPVVQKKILINLASRSLALYEGNRKVNLYPIGAGKTTTPTPVGYYSILDKTENPSWIDPEDPKNSIPSGEKNPLGYRWMQYNGNYGIHGTNKPESIGGYVSNGCIRMRESDVEELFNKVDAGTPVEITYNRVVVEKAADHTIVYYIYPDGYGWQTITAADVNKWLTGYGVGSFVSDADIEAKIAASDGNPTYIAKVYPLYVNGSKLKNKAVVQNGITYLPAIDLADAAKVSLGWDEKTSTLTSTLGKAPGFNKKDVLYCSANDASTLFHLTGALAANKTYTMVQAQNEAPATVTSPASTPATVTTAPAAAPAETTAKATKPATTAKAK